MCKNTWKQLSKKTLFWRHCDVPFVQKVPVLWFVTFCLINFKCKSLSTNNMGNILLEDRLPVQTTRNQKLGATALLQHTQQQDRTLAAWTRLANVSTRGTRLLNTTLHARMYYHIIIISLCPHGRNRRWDDMHTSGCKLNSYASIQETASELNIGNLSMQVVSPYCWNRFSQWTHFVECRRPRVHWRNSWEATSAFTATVASTEGVW